MNWYYKIKYFLLNIWHHRKSLWNSRPWDYSGMYLVLRDNITYLRNSVDKYSLHVRKDRDVKEMTVCIKLLDRLIEDDYNKQTCDSSKGIFNFEFYPTHFLPKGKFMTLCKLEDSIRKQDMELLFKILNKKSRSWWH